MSDSLQAAVLGAGAWGTALALVLVERGHDVRLWSYESEVADTVQRTHRNPYLDGITMPDRLHATSDLISAVEGAQLVVSVSPSQVVRSVMREAAPHLERDAVVVSASKGIELGSLRRMDEVLSEEL
ncbi:MAG: NAD(P)-binding domain-containing protein, partial [Longimicrobiales bacterium]|nr:NAD(P)-binding domain-containing protein [Longimicrobiales bacterium]